MISRLALIAVQLVVGWFAGQQVLPYLPNLDRLNIFLAAVVFAVIVWVIGLVAGLALKDVATPSPQTLIFALASGVIFALITLVPEAEKAIVSVVGHQVPHLLYPLIGTVVGYAVQR
jgi:hypothetical protein